jgi:hypothetical protein
MLANPAREGFAAVNLAARATGCLPCKTCQIGGQPVRDWPKAYQARLAHIKAGSKPEAADWRSAEGTMPLRRMRINGLRRLRQKLLEKRNALFHADRDGTRERRAELDEQMDAIDAVEERKDRTRR